MSYEYYRDPQNGYVHEDQVESMMREAEFIAELAVEDLESCAKELGFAEDALYAVELVTSAEVALRTVDKGHGPMRARLYVCLILEAYKNNDQDFIASVTAVAGQGWDR